MILVDDREPKALIRQLQEIGRGTHVEVIQSRLDAGDFILCPEGDSGIKTVGVERKTVGDLLHSISDERLRRQLLNTQADWGIAYLLIEGHRNYTVSSEGKRILHHSGTAGHWTFGMVENFLAAIQLSGIRVVQFGTQTDSLAWLAGFHKLLSDVRDVEVLDTGRMRDRSIPPSVAALCQVPRLGPKVGKVLIERFGSVAGVCQAGDKELLGVPDVGPTLVGNIRKVLGRIE